MSWDLSQPQCLPSGTNTAAFSMGHIFSDSACYLHPMLCFLIGPQSSPKNSEVSCHQYIGVPLVANSQSHLREFKQNSEHTSFSSVVSIQGSLGTWRAAYGNSLPLSFVPPSLQTKPLVHTPTGFIPPLFYRQIKSPNIQETGQVHSENRAQDSFQKMRSEDEGRPYSNIHFAHHMQIGKASCTDSGREAKLPSNTSLLRASQHAAVLWL